MNFLQRSASWLALPLGAALALAFAPFNVWPLAVLCPAWLFLAWDGATPKRAAKIGFLFYAGTFLAGTYWLYHSVYVIGKAPLPVAILLMLGLVAIMGAYLALLAYLQARWLPNRGLIRFLIALPSSWLLLEWLRGWLFSGFPWLSLGYAAIDTPIAGFAPLIGVYGIGLLLALSAGAIAAIIVALANKARPHALAVISLVLPWIVGIGLWHREWTEPTGKEISVAIVQGAVPQEMKWTQEQHDATLKLYHDLTVPHWGAQLIIWPESALPDWAESLTDYLSNLWQEAAVHRSHLLMGQQHFDVQADKAYNSVLALSDRQQWYSKRHLVPFGEYFPVPEFVRAWMRLMSLPHSDFASGAEDQPPLSAAGQKIAVTICYEDAYGSSQLKILDEATLLVNVTNDAWFGDSTARHQHLQISRMRALEVGRPLLRAANDGISGIIDSQGNVKSQLPSFKADVLTGVIQPRAGLTLYAKIGNWFAVVVSLLMVAVAAMIANTGRANAGRENTSRTKSS